MILFLWDPKKCTELSTCRLSLITPSQTLLSRKLRLKFLVSTIVIRSTGIDLALLLFFVICYFFLLHYYHLCVFLSSCSFPIISITFIPNSKLYLQHVQIQLSFKSLFICILCACACMRVCVRVCVFKTSSRSVEKQEKRQDKRFNKDTQLRRA